MTIAAIALFTPIMLPILKQVGIDPYMIGIIMIVNLGIGMITPPVGNCLYVACGMSKNLSFEQISKACLPYVVALAVALRPITYVEPISMGLIWLTGMKRFPCKPSPTSVLTDEDPWTSFREVQGSFFDGQ